MFVGGHDIAQHIATRSRRMYVLIPGYLLCVQQGGTMARKAARRTNADISGEDKSREDKAREDLDAMEVVAESYFRGTLDAVDASVTHFVAQNPRVVDSLAPANRWSSVQPACGSVIRPAVPKVASGLSPTANSSWWSRIGMSCRTAVA